MEKAVNPLVSVIIPVYNGDNYLQEAIESIFRQTYAHYEVIVVDDGSKDSTWQVIQSYGSKIRGYHKPNGGVASALNWGIARAQGDWIAWLSHDDVFFPEKLEKQLRFLSQNPEYQACYTDFEIVDANGEYGSTVRTSWFPAKQLPRQFLRNMFINGSTVLIHRVCFERTGGFDESLSHTQDLEMWLRIAQNFEFGRLPVVLLKSRSHPGQGAMAFEIQLDQEQALFCRLYQRLGPQRFFPELEPLRDPQQVEAQGRRLLGDELARYRGWYRFALDQYQLSSRLQPSFQTWLKIAHTRTCLILWGDEKESQLLGKRARVLSGQGKRFMARELSAKFWLRHPLRLDALLTWFRTWAPDSLIAVLKRLKRRL